MRACVPFVCLGEGSKGAAKAKILHNAGTSAERHRWQVEYTECPGGRVEDKGRDRGGRGGQRKEKQGSKWKKRGRSWLSCGEL